MMAEYHRRNEWDISVSMIRVGDLVLTRDLGTAHLTRVKGANHEIGEGDEAARLPAKEAGLLAFLMRHHREIVSKSRLIEAVWGLGGTEAGVLDVHMARLRRTLGRLDPSGATARIETRRGMGYALHVENSNDAN